MTVLYGQGDGIVGERIITYARRIELMSVPIPRTHRHRTQGAKLRRGMLHREAYLIEEGVTLRSRGAVK